MEGLKSLSHFIVKAAIVMPLSCISQGCVGLAATVPDIGTSKVDISDRGGFDITDSDLRKPMLHETLEIIDPGKTYRYGTSFNGCFQLVGFIPLFFGDCEHFEQWESKLEDEITITNTVFR